ncbi:hypothetical protein BG006_006690 [Podila minutissima]|uniref:Uncharacterized protein n=1 Tax=Podila minutissima TaxID=64525 RepID=A0A9P5VL70_9FUNG|nr:hypothetical protein BG006_006690 [Podila minutissima]
MSPSFSPSPPRSLLERDLAEAIATDARLPFTGSFTSGRRLSSDLGLHPKPNLDSVRKSVSRSNSERSSFSSAQSAGGSPGEVQKVAIEHDSGKDRKVDEKEESDGEIDDNLAKIDNNLAKIDNNLENVIDSEVAEDTSAETQDRDKKVALEGTLDEDSKDKEASPESRQTTPRSRSASPDSSLASSHLSQNTADEFKSENASYQSPSTSTHETSPPHSPIATSPLHSSGQGLNQATKEPERIHHPFYALGIHGQTPTDAYATEIEESIQKGNKPTPPSAHDSSDEDNSSASPSQASSVLKELSEGSNREKAENEEESGPDQQANEVQVSPSLSPDKENTPKSSGSSPHSTGSLFNSGHEDDDQGSQDDSLEDQEDNDKENNGFDLHSPVSTKSSTSTLRPMSSISSISLTDDYLTTGSEDDDTNTDHPSQPSNALEGNTSPLSALTQEQRRVLEQKQRRRHRRQQLVDDAKRKQEQLDRIKAQLELRRLGKIRQQVSFWEEKGVLEQRVVSVEEVEVEVEVPDLDDN